MASEAAKILARVAEANYWPVDTTSKFEKSARLNNLAEALDKCLVFSGTDFTIDGVQDDVWPIRDTDNADETAKIMRKDGVDVHASPVYRITPGDKE